MTKKILVTGGAGFIGSHLCEKLLENKCSVIALDNLYSGKKEHLSDISKNKNFTFVKGDVRNKSLVTKYVKRVDVVFHLAAILGVSKVVDNPRLAMSVNIHGVENVCNACLDGKKKLVFTSSSEVYGKNSSIPLRESDDLLFGPTNITRWNYGLSKAIGEHIIWAYSKFGLPFTIVRLFNSYGPRGINNSYSHVIPKFIISALENKPLTIYGDGKQSRSFCFVKDTVDGIFKTYKNLENEVVNVGNKHEIIIDNLAKKIIELTKSKSKVKYILEEKVFGKNFESVFRRVPDTSKLNNLRFTPKYGLEKGLKTTIEWTKKYQF